jgi:hypothetical protein
VAAFAAPACSTVLVSSDDGADDVPVGAPDPATPDPAGPKPTCTADPADVVDVRFVESASFIEYILHVEGSIDENHDYAILDIVDQGVAKVVEVRPDLVGGASWTEFAADPPEHIYARSRGTTLEVMQGSAEGAELVATHDLGVPLVPGAEATGTSQGRLHLCLDTGESPPRFHEFDALQPLALPYLGASEPCEVYDGEARASWNLWVNNGDTDVGFRWLGTEIGNSHGWVPDGVHAYGAVTAAETDGEVIAVTMENDAYAFLYYPAESAQFVVYSSFGSGDKKLLAVNNGRAIVALPDPAGARVVSFQIDPPPPWEEEAPRGDLDALIRGVSGGIANLQMLAHDGNWAVISDGLSFFVVPIWGETVNDPLLVVRDDASVVCDR